MTGNPKIHTSLNNDLTVTNLKVGKFNEWNK